MFNLFRSAVNPRVLALHEAMVTASRRPSFFRAGVPDTVDGRFNLLILHLYLMLRALRDRDDKLAQQLFDHTFTVLDLNLREMGVGDMGVGKRIKVMGKAFYGQAEAYESGDLAGALSRNLFGTLAEAPSPQMLAPFVAYMEREIKAGATEFGDFP